MLKKKGIRKAYYSDTNGKIVCEFVDNMKSNYISSGNRYIKKILF